MNVNRDYRQYVNEQTHKHSKQVTVAALYLRLNLYSYHVAVQGLGVSMNNKSPLQSDSSESTLILRNNSTNGTIDTTKVDMQLEHHDTHKPILSRYTYFRVDLWSE